jgi:glutaconyl-CoA/methylmalonyl-CoA decarboxylase subunit delta
MEVIFVGPVTTNPWLIAIINMTIVFGVLIALGVLMSLIQVIDPTRTKTK